MKGKVILMEKERRKFKRFDTYMSVKYEAPKSGKGTNGVSLSKDLCREGLKINSQNSIDEGSLLDLEITIPDDPRPIVTSGEVMWSRPCDGKKQGFDQGVRLLTMDPVDKFRVLDFAYNYWLESKINNFSEPESLNEIG